jgi:lipopolysaccharide transport system ATP-binding protein
MSDIAIKVENLSKRYRIGLKEELPDTIVGAMTGWLRAPLANFRGLRRLSHFGENGHDDPDVIWALKDVSFEVKQGEVMGVIGRNGAGKSTLLKILSRITQPTSGRAVINGRVSSLLEVGTGFHPELTGRENVYLNGTVLGMSKVEIDRKFDEIVDFSGVEKFIDTPVKRYSSGMQVRLAFSVAAHLEPEILLVDEVLAVGDAEFQKKCLGKMESVAGEGRTVLFVSHNMDAIQRLCGRSILLEGGHVALDDHTRQVVQRYLTTRYIDGSGDVSLNSLPREEGLGERVKLTRCTVLNSRGETSNRLLFGEPFTISLEATSQLQLHDLSFFIGIDSSTEQRITTINSGDSGKVLSMLPKSPIRIYARVDKLVLKPGAYLLTVGIRSGSRYKLDRLPHIMQVEVMSAVYQGTKPALAPSGLVHATASWEQIAESGAIIPVGYR